MNPKPYTLTENHVDCLGVGATPYPLHPHPPSTPLYTRAPSITCPLHPPSVFQGACKKGATKASGIGARGGGERGGTLLENSMALGVCLLKFGEASVVEECVELWSGLLSEPLPLLAMPAALDLCQSGCCQVVFPSTFDP